MCKMCAINYRKLNASTHDDFGNIGLQKQLDISNRRQKLPTKYCNWYPSYCQQNRCIVLQHEYQSQSVCWWILGVFTYTLLSLIEIFHIQSVYCPEEAELIAWSDSKFTLRNDVYSVIILIDIIFQRIVS